MKLMDFVNVCLVACGIMASLQLITSTIIHADSSGCHSGEVALLPNLVLLPRSSSHDCEHNNCTRRPHPRRNQYHQTNNNATIDNTIASNPKPSSHRSLMIIAIYPSSPRKIAALWSQLECFSQSFDDVVISSPVHLHNETTNFLRLVETKLPEVWKKLKVKFYINDRHDMGLWCDALDDEAFSRDVPHENDTTDNPPTDSNNIPYDEIMLINDSIIAMENTDVFLTTLRTNRLSLLSLNYRNETNRKYWLESPLRVFDRKGIRLFSRNICRMRSIRWRRDCPHVGKIYRPSERDKRCVVERTEIDLVDYFEEGEVMGLFSATNEKGEAWIDTIEYWEYLRGVGFPVGKVSRARMFQRIKASRREDLLRCTAGLRTEWLD
mmetsp:Transcript_14411/g.30730  ORF Transcript_14411/g.30730 Transcript_14411/m.30730 type:complete len:380 (-) Transcript_14411:15-1154(-)